VGQAVAGLNLDQLTKENAAMAKQSSALAVDLGDRAERLVNAVNVFSLQGAKESE